jgi:hypothetical protein
MEVFGDTNNSQMFRKLFGIKFISPAPLLGRWTRTSEKVNSIKIFWANVDHCGTCISEAVKKKEVPKLVSPPPEVKETH